MVLQTEFARQKKKDSHLKYTDWVVFCQWYCDLPTENNRRLICWWMYEIPTEYIRLYIFRYVWQLLLNADGLIPSVILSVSV
jgi:hypothetical protein